MASRQAEILEEVSAISGDLLLVGMGAAILRSYSGHVTWGLFTIVFVTVGNIVVNSVVRYRNRKNIEKLGYVRGIMNS
jgi:hypothetical protein